MLKRGESPIYEPGLDDLLKRNLGAGRLNFTTDAAEGVKHGLFQFIAVGTPPDGRLGRSQVRAQRRRGDRPQRRRVSGGRDQVDRAGRHRRQGAREDRQHAQERGVQIEFDVVSNPEFLKEGAAIADFMKPDRIIVGTDNPRTAELLKALYDPFTRSRERMIVMDVRSAELTKYAANAMLATKISFMNELANLAERMGADIEKVRLGIGSDPRIGYHFIYPGCGYGGSCFPKDVQALARSAGEHSFEPRLLDAVEAVNKRQKSVLLDKLKRHFGGELAGKTIALWGLAFKPNTDDMREAPSRTLIEGLWAAGEGARVRSRCERGSAAASTDSVPTSTLVGSSTEALRGATRWRSSPSGRNSAAPTSTPSRPS